MAQIRESLKIKEPKVYDYNGQSIRIVIISEMPWWVLSDICKVLDLKNPSLIARAVDFDDKMFAKVRTYRSAQKVYVINEDGLHKVMQGSEAPNVIDFKKWLAKEELINNSVNNSAKAEKKSSVEASIQRAGMFIRMAEHKAVPQIEQRRLINMAIQELTGSTFEFTDVISKAAQDKAKSLEQEVEIMNLPEVIDAVGFAQVLKLGGYRFCFYPVRNIAERIHITPLEFDEFANKHGLKDGTHGIWVRVDTPEGEAREHMYMQEVAAIYLMKQK
ncbi:MAG: hypothetical protein IJ728_01500 [Selenomonadaceae bacterium]|nr:hypothetical protein [Selenomonadaceae bacterium]